MAASGPAAAGECYRPGPLAENRMIIYSLLLIILMLTRPQGLFGVGALKKTKRA